MTEKNIGLKEGMSVLQTAIVSLAGVAYFDKKLDVMNALLNLEWDLRQEVDKEKECVICQEFDGEREEPWND